MALFATSWMFSGRKVAERDRKLLCYCCIEERKAKKKISVHIRLCSRNSCMFEFSLTFIYDRVICWFLARDSSGHTLFSFRIASPCLLSSYSSFFVFCRSPLTAQSSVSLRGENTESLWHTESRDGSRSAANAFVFPILYPIKK